MSLSLRRTKIVRPSILPENIMKRTIDTVDSLRLKDAPVSLVVVNERSSKRYRDAISITDGE